MRNVGARDDAHAPNFLYPPRQQKMAPKSSQSPSRSKSPARATPKKKPAAATLPKSPADFYPAPGTAPPAPAPHPTDVDLFASYSRLWAVSEAVIGYGTVYLVPGCHSFFPTECVETPWWFYSQCILWLIVLLYPSRFSVTISMLVRVAQYWAQAPMTWESCYWAKSMCKILTNGAACSISM